MMNAHSSRSHAVLLLTARQVNLLTGAGKTSQLYLADLAGSESISRAGGGRLRETSNINRSLFTLGSVIEALARQSRASPAAAAGAADAADGASPAAALEASSAVSDALASAPRALHVPYHDSKLTRLLQNALGGNSRTALIVACSSEAADASETLSSLRFGARAASIETKPRPNEFEAIESLRSALTDARFLISRQQAEIHALRMQLAALQAPAAFALPRAAPSDYAALPQYPASAHGLSTASPGATSSPLPVATLLPAPILTGHSAPPCSPMTHLAPGAHELAATMPPLPSSAVAAISSPAVVPHGDVSGALDPSASPLELRPPVRRCCASMSTSSLRSCHTCRWRTCSPSAGRVARPSSSVAAAPSGCLISPLPSATRPRATTRTAMGGPSSSS